MNKDMIVLYSIATAAFCFGLINCIQFLLHWGKTATTTGTIISVKTLNPETDKTRNSKWAIVSYQVDGRTIQSQNRIQVPMAAEIGSTVRVRYHILKPETLYCFSGFRILGAFCISGICMLITLSIRKM